MSSGGDDHGLGEVRLALLQIDPLQPVRLGGDRGHPSGDQLGTEGEGMDGHDPAQFRSLDRSESRVILDVLGEQQLPTGDPRLEQDSPLQRPAGIKGGGEAGRPGADDGDLVLALVHGIPQ